MAIGERGLGVMKPTVIYSGLFQNRKVSCAQVLVILHLLISLRSTRYSAGFYLLRIF